MNYRTVIFTALTTVVGTVSAHSGTGTPTLNGFGVPTFGQYSTKETIVEKTGYVPVPGPQGPAGPSGPPGSASSTTSPVQTTVEPTTVERKPVKE